jgi:hypothetical protein
MPQLEYFLVAESISVDQSTNRVSLFNILEEVQITRIPAGTQIPPRLSGIPQVVAIGAWNIDPDEHGREYAVSLRVHVPGHSSPVQGPALTFVAEKRRQRTILLLVGCPVGGPGEIRFELLLDGNHAASHLITAILAEDQPTDAALARPISGSANE